MQCVDETHGRNVSGLAIRSVIGIGICAQNGDGPQRIVIHDQNVSGGARRDPRIERTTRYPRGRFAGQ